MFAKITKGDRTAGLMVYLAGQGRYNEHTNPHIVAGDPGVMAWYAEDELNRESALSVARYLERPHRAHAEQQAAGGVMTKTAPHVWQCSIAIRPWEGELADDEWREVAEKFLDKMGFTSEGEDAPVRWAAVRHGLSAKGNDHIHLVVDLVREDGSRASVDQDFARARDASRELEAEFGLAPLHPNEYDLAKAHARVGWESARRAEVDAGQESRFPWAELTEELQDAEVAKEFATPETWERAYAARDQHAEAGTRTKGYKYGEREAVGRRRAQATWTERHESGEETHSWVELPAAERARLSAEATPVEQPRETLGRMVRACSTAATDEAEFVRRLRKAGVKVRPRYEKGRTDVVTGYSVALRPAGGEQTIWYGGGTLDDDLRLPRLRAEWPDTAESAGGAVAEWNAVTKRQRPVAPGREEATPTDGEWEQMIGRVKQLREQLRELPVDDPSWPRVARQSAGAFAAWSTATETDGPGPLAATADALARSAKTTRPAPRPKVPLPSVAGTAYLLMAASKDNPTVATAALARELANLAKALHDMHKATNAARRAQVIENTIRGQLATVAANLPDSGAAAKGQERTSTQTTQRPQKTQGPQPGRPRTGPRQPPGRPDRDIER